MQFTTTTTAVSRDPCLMSTRRCFKLDGWEVSLHTVTLASGTVSACRQLYHPTLLLTYLPLIEVRLLRAVLAAEAFTIIVVWFAKPVVYLNVSSWRGVTATDVVARFSNPCRKSQ